MAIAYVPAGRPVPLGRKVIAFRRYFHFRLIAQTRRPDTSGRHVGTNPNPQLVLSDYLELGDKLGGKMTALASRFRNLTQIEFLFPTTRVFSNFVFLRGSTPLENI